MQKSFSSSAHWFTTLPGSTQPDSWGTATLQQYGEIWQPINVRHLRVSCMSVLYYPSLLINSNRHLLCVCRCFIVWPMCSPTHSPEILSPFAPHLYHFTSWLHYLSPFSPFSRSLTLHTTAWLTFSRGEGLHAEHLGLWNFKSRCSGFSPTALPLSSLLAPSLLFDLSVSRRIFDFPLSIYVLSPLSLSNTSHCVDQQNGSPPPPPASFTGQSRPP